MVNYLWSKTDYKGIRYYLHIDLDQGHCTPFIKKICLSISQIGLNGEKKKFLCDPIWPWYLTYKHSSRSLHVFLPKALCGWCMRQMEQRERGYALDKDFSYNYAMTITFDLEIWFKVTTHSLLKSTFFLWEVWARAEWKIYMPWYFWWSDMNLTIDLQNLFKVTVYHLTIDTL